MSRGITQTLSKTAAGALERDLRAALEGEVRFDAGALALYSTDSSNYRQVPIGVVFPKHVQDVEKAIALCRAHRAPVLSRGAGTSLAGQTCNTAVVFDFSRHMNRILSLDPVARVAEVEPGVILDHLRREAEKYGLTFGPDPATHSRCTIGGMIGNNSCGVHSLMSGKTVDNVESLDLLTYDGARLTVGATSNDQLDAIIREGGRRAEIYDGLKRLRDQHSERIRARYPKIPRRVSGYNLDELLPEQGFQVARALVGSEGTCVTVVKARLKLIPNPRAKRLLVLGFPDIYQAAEAVMPILEAKPIGLEGMDVDMVSHLGRYRGFPEKILVLPKGEAWLLVEFGAASAEEADTNALKLLQRLERSETDPAVRLCRKAEDAQALWSIRESVLAATAFIPGAGDRHEGWEDTAVPPSQLSPYLRDLRTLYNRYGYHGAFYGHFGDGCLHTRIDFDLDTEDGRAKTLRFLNEAADLVIRYGGSLSGEHGDGHARAALLPKMFGPELVKAFEDFKRLWDPAGGMNPGKIVNAYGILDHLRTGGTFHPKEPQTHFRYPVQENSFVRAVLRCVGVGKCRNEEGGLMCPSYQATRDETHSTRGRARLLFEMLQGELIQDGWKSEAVKNALDLCLSCKGCKIDCPTNVDMAAYKAEFLSHYYEHHRRPLNAYLFGWIHHWARIGSLAPRVANFFTQTPGFSHLAKAIAGVAQARAIPALAKQTFRQWFVRRAAQQAPARREVILWTDTFTNYFTPQPAHAAVELLESLGYRVKLPPAGLCCGRPLYDHGMLDQAKRQLQAIMKALEPDLEAGVAIVGLEPGCISVFRDELENLFPKDLLAQKLRAQTFLLSEWLVTGPLSEPDRPTPQQKRRVVLQTHCHQKSVMSAKADRELLEAAGCEVEQPESGCCGMAGSFGFEAHHQSIATTLVERALAPAVRAAASDVAIVADGFSCREQIRQSTGKNPAHSVEIAYCQLFPSRACIDSADTPTTAKNA